MKTIILIVIDYLDTNYNIIDLFLFYSTTLQIERTF